MKIHRFIGDFSFKETSVTLMDSALVHHMGRVLRLQVGELVILCDGQGEEIQGEIDRMDKKQVVVKIHERRKNATEPSIHVILCLALIKRENFEFALQKAVEVGVSEIIPVITERTIKQRLNMERARTIVREAAEQSGRGRVPLIREPLSFIDACEAVKPSQQAFFFDLNAPRFDPSCYVLRDACCLFIGPEGGWTEQEKALAKTDGFATVGLGPRILRAETAAIVASYLFNNINL